MPLPAGTHLGPYEIVAPIGKGGMGEVYRARDGKLGREVAIKVLRDELANDIERIARFEREAKLLASLNHPNIAGIYGFEETSGVKALVLELVKGPTLADRMAHGPIPADEAVAIARQIANALEAGHELGIVHRDLKPANVKVKEDGAVKVLDYGLAKTFEGNVEATPDSEISESPTLTRHGTEMGTILGTAAYMSPEQAKGKRVDRRTDIWAFGAVVYEMLAGRPAFRGDDSLDTLAAVLHDEPAWELLPAGLPPVVVMVLQRCLQKSTSDRMRDAGDIRLALDGAFGGGQTTFAGRSLPASRWLAAGVLLALLAGAVVGWSLRPSDSRDVTWLSHVLPPDESFSNPAQSLVTIAPDGSSIVYVANGQLYRRAMNELESLPIRGTAGSPSSPFFSPDGGSLAYWDSATKALRRIPAEGGTPVTLARTSILYGASWGSDDAILYGQEDGIYRAPVGGGAPERIVAIENDELVYGPRVLPDGANVLFSIVKRGAMVGQSTAWDAARIVVQSLETGERTELARGSDARFVPTGHLIYAVDTVLFAIDFDPQTLRIGGGPAAIVEGVARATRGSSGQGGGASYDFSREGTFVFVPELDPRRPVPRRLVAVDREGNAVPLIDDQRDYWRPRISPEGNRVAVEVFQEDRIAQLWIVHLERGTSSPLAEGESGYVVWTPDGKFVVYRRVEGETAGIHRQAADGSSAAELLLAVPEVGSPSSVSRDGIIAFTTTERVRDIRTFSMKDGVATDFLNTPAREHMASFSPDGRWLAYTSDESGTDEVYVRPFPKTTGVAILVSVGGGSGPVWSPDGSTLYYRGASGQIMEMSTTLVPRFIAGRPHPLFEFEGLYRMSGTAAAYDVHPDGERFIMVTEADSLDDSRSPQRVNLVLNWFEDLKRRIPAKE